MIWSKPDSVPTGWQECDGTNGTPDLRGLFVRGWDNGQGGYDPQRTFGSFQDDAQRRHTHPINDIKGSFKARGRDNAGSNEDMIVLGTQTGGFSVAYEGSNASASRGAAFANETRTTFSSHRAGVTATNENTNQIANENRSKNIALMYIMKMV